MSWLPPLLWSLREKDWSIKEVTGGFRTQLWKNFLGLFSAPLFFLFSFFCLPFPGAFIQLLFGLGRRRRRRVGNLVVVVVVAWVATGGRAKEDRADEVLQRSKG